MKFCPECGAKWQNPHSDTCTACGYTLPQAMNTPGTGTPSAAPAAYAPPVQPAAQNGEPYPAPSAAASHPGAPLPQRAPDLFSTQPTPSFGQEPAQPEFFGTSAPASSVAPAPLYPGTGPAVPPQSTPSLFGEEARTSPPTAPLFQDTAPMPSPLGAPPLFDEEVPRAAAPPPQQRSAAAKAASLQALLEAEDDVPGFEPTPPPSRGGYNVQDTRPHQRTHYEESYEDDYAPARSPRTKSGGSGGSRGRDSGKSRAGKGRDDRGRNEPPPRRPRDDFEDDYDAPGARRGGGGGGRSKGLVILAIVLAVAVVATLIFAVLYLGGFLDGSRTSPETSSSVATSVSAAPETQVSSSVSDFAAQLTTSEINDVIGEFYQSYLQCINQEDLAPLTRATELCRTEVASRIEKSFNKENQFNFISAACDEQSIQYGEDNGRPAVVCNAKFEYSHRPKADANAEYTNGSNYQTVQLVYEQYQWKVNRFVMIDASEYENHTVASFA